MGRVYYTLALRADGLPGPGKLQSAVVALVSGLDQAYRFRRNYLVTYAIERHETDESRADRLQRALNMVSDAVSEIEELKGELETWLDNIPDNLKGGDTASELQTAIDALGECIEQLDGVADTEVDFPSW